MGWLKNLFRKKEAEKISLSISEVSGWVDERLKPAINEVNQRLLELFSDVADCKEKLARSIEELENAEIEYKGHVDNKVKSVVLGHRSNYARMLRNFINTANLPEEINYTNALKFYSATAESLNKFSIESAKTFYTAQHLFHKQVDEIAKSIKEFDRNLKLIKDAVESNNLHYLSETKSKIKEIDEQAEKRKEIQESIDSLKIRLAGSKESRIEFSSRLEELKNSRDYAELENLKVDLKRAESEAASADSEIIQLFSSLEHPLRKYQKIAIEDIELIGKYAEKASEALVSDEEFRIIGIIINLKKSILSDSIELKDGKKEKAVETIDRIDKEVLDSLVAKRKQAQAKKKDIEEQIKANKSMDMVKEAEYKLEHATSIIERLKSEINEKEETLKSIDMDKLKSELEALLKKLTGAEVIVSF